jgi:tRNA (mo5U34)-methyltransferase
MSAGPSAATDLQRRIAAVGEWYHTLELAPGVVTPGFFDHRPILDRVGLPASFEGRRCLDVGTFNGFWAFEMERRGASEVVAMDVPDPHDWDWPAGATEETLQAFDRRKAGDSGFEIAHEALGSSVEWLPLSVYELDPEIHGSFDFVYLGSLLMHLRDPIGALMRVRSVCSDALLVVDNVDLPLTLAFGNRPAASLEGAGRPWWWKPTVAGLARMIDAAGFAVQGSPVRFRMPPGPGTDPLPVSLGTLRSRIGRDDFVRTRFGDPHAAVHARVA